MGGRLHALAGRSPLCPERAGARTAALLNTAPGQRPEPLSEVLGDGSSTGISAKAAQSRRGCWKRRSGTASPRYSPTFFLPCWRGTKAWAVARPASAPPKGERDRGLRIKMPQDLRLPHDNRRDL